ncbi:metal-dependent hydrolase family protein [Hamadaea tsunoensis]|uniref:metal-dependent hydrolase family protein n=1 Tax=Hamadaea tsunoensis TaxID=53368 RepID=UPI000420FEFC|nr:amidohydrolase family protein [Hamadaea tsunoensis]
MIVYRGAEVFDGHDVSVTDVGVADGGIVAMGAGLDGERLVDLTGFGLLPGFVDCHVHVTVSSMDPGVLLRTPASYRILSAARNLRRTLAAGVTTARDADGADAGLRQAIDDGLIPGPRLRIAITMLSQTGGRGDYRTASGVPLPAFPDDRPPGVVDGVEQMRRAVRGLVAAGADVIKIAVSGSALGTDADRAQLRDDEIAEAVAEASAAGLPVMAHAHSAEGALRAIRHGVHSIEHGSGLSDEAIAEMADRGTWLVPTLAAGRATGDTEYADRHVEAFRRARAAGVRIAMGSDSGLVAHGQNLTELTALVEAGMSPCEALTTATYAGARLLHLDERIGTLAPKRQADLVVVAGGVFPVETIARRIVAVLRDGRVVAGRLPS